ncbi:TPA: restriction endonuclease subunit S [Serratia marcescens]
MMNNIIKAQNINTALVCYKHTEIGMLPKDWDAAPLVNICKEIGDGIHTTPVYSGSGKYYFINGNNISDGQVFTDDNTKKVSESEFLKHQKKLTKKTILLSINGTIGNTAFYNGEYLVLGKSAAYLTVKDNTSEKFIYYAIQTSQTKKQFDDGMTASTIKNLGLATIRQTIVPIPTIEEQIAIANVLSDTDALITELENLIEKKQAIKTATIQQLLTGRTRLPQFSRHPDGTLKGYKTSELGKLPEDWTVLTYGEIFDFLSTSTNSRSDLSHSGEYGYIHYGDIHTKWNNKLDASLEELPKISKKIVSSSLLENGDIIMADASEDYSGIGKSVEICNIGNQKIVAGLHTYLLRDKSKLLSDGYRGYLHSNVNVKKIIEQLATGMKVFGISKNNLLTVPVPVPSKQEQTAIAAILSDMDTELEALQQKLAKVREIKQGMMQQLLTGRIRLPLDHQP